MANLYSANTTLRTNYFRNSTDRDISNTTNTEMNCDMFHFIMFTAVGGPMYVVGFIANIICFIILKNESGKKHHAATFLLQALAVADNFILLFWFCNFAILKGLLPMLGIAIRNNVNTLYFKQYVTPCVYMAQMGMVWITVLIATNRYIAVCKPFDAYRLASLTKTKIQVAVMVALAIIFNLPRFFLYTISYTEGTNTLAVPSLTESGLINSQLYTIISVAVCYLILPLLLLILFNIRIIWELRKVKEWKDAIRQNTSGSDRNITIVMVVIIIVFLVCNMPSHTIWIIGNFIHMSRSCSGWYAAHCVSQLLLAANSSTNFVIYYVLRKSFRCAFLKALSCCRPM